MRTWLIGILGASMAAIMQGKAQDMSELPRSSKQRAPGEHGPGQYSLEQAVSDRAQLHTIAICLGAWPAIHAGFTIAVDFQPYGTH